MPSVIALDAMGSDKAPKPEIEGALQAARHHGARVLLVGPESLLKAELARYPGARHLPIDVVHASEVITMDDKVEAIRGNLNKMRTLMLLHQRELLSTEQRVKFKTLHEQWERDRRANSLARENERRQQN